MELAEQDVVRAFVPHVQERASGRMHHRPRFLAGCRAGFTVDPEPVGAEGLIGKRWWEGIARGRCAWGPLRQWGWLSPRRGRDALRCASSKCMRATRDEWTTRGGGPARRGCHPRCGSSLHIFLFLLLF